MIKIKQNITSQQLEELSDKQIKALFNYWWDKNGIGKNELTPSEKIPFGYSSLYELPLMSIGDMIEYLIYNKDQNFTIERYLQYEGVDFEEMIWEVHDYIDPELCDCLWELTKKVLNK